MGEKVCPKCGSEMTMASATTEDESWWRCGNGLCTGHGHEEKVGGEKR